MTARCRESPTQLNPQPHAISDTSGAPGPDHHNGRPTESPLRRVGARGAHTVIDAIAIGVVDDAVAVGSGVSRGHQRCRRMVVVLLAAVIVAVAVAVPLLLRARRRRAWRADLAAAEGEVAWFARVLVPQLRLAESLDRPLAAGPLDRARCPRSRIG